MFSLGLVGKEGKPLHLSTIQGILSNPFYYGHFKYRGEIHQGSHKPMDFKETPPFIFVVKRKSMHYVYILKIKNRVKLLYYIGYTRDLKRRIFEHQKDNEIELIYYEAYQSEKIAKTRERKLKQYSGAWRSLKQRLNLD